MANPKYKKWIEEDGLALLNGWARDGLTDEQIANNCGINVATLYRWKNEHQEISEALKKGKEVVDYEVENALLKRAKGYDYEEVQTVIKDTPSGIVKKVVKIKKHMPPDVMAAVIWLNNRKPEKWRRNAGKEKLDEKRFDHDREIDAKKYWY